MFRTAVFCALLCGAAASAACRTSPTAAVTHPDPEAPEVARRDPFAVVEVGAVHAIARDATHLYWADERGLHRRPLGDAEAGKAELLSDEPAPWPEVPALAVGGGLVYLSDGLTVATVPVGGGAMTTVAELDSVSAIAIAEDGRVFVATAAAVVRLGGAGKPPVEVVRGALRIHGLVLAGDHLYWIDGDGSAAASVGGYGPYVDPFAPAPAPASGAGDGAVLRRIALAGGAVEELARELRAPGELAVRDGRVYWTSAVEPALQSVAITGGAPRTEMSGRGSGVLADAHGVVVRHLNGMISERRGDRPAELRLISDGTWFPPPRRMVATDAWLYVIASRNLDGTSAVLALPRQDERIRVLVTTVHPLMKLRAAGGTLVWAENAIDGTGINLVRADPATGARRDLGRHSGWLNELAVGGGQIYFADDTVIYRLPLAGGAIKTFHRTDAWIGALTPHRNHVYWLNGSVLWARKRSGGRAFEIARTEYGYGGGEPNADMVFDDDYVYLNTFGSGAPGVYRISERGETTNLWSGGDQSYPSKDLIKFGDELCFAAGGSIFKLPLDGTAVSLYRATSDSWISDLVGGGGLLYAMVTHTDYWEIVRIDPVTGEARAVLRWNQYAHDQTPFDADDTGAYVYLAAFDAILRIGHDAPAIPPLGWPTQDR